MENKLQYLNSENEWFFDNDTKYLYVWLPSDEVPSLTNKYKTTKLFFKCYFG